MAGIFRTVGIIYLCLFVICGSFKQDVEFSSQTLPPIESEHENTKGENLTEETKLKQADSTDLLKIFTTKSSKQNSDEWVSEKETGVNNIKNTQKGDENLSATYNPKLSLLIERHTTTFAKPSSLEENKVSSKSIESIENTQDNETIIDTALNSNKSRVLSYEAQNFTLNLPVDSEKLTEIVPLIENTSNGFVLDKKASSTENVAILHDTTNEYSLINSIPVLNITESTSIDLLSNNGAIPSLTIPLHRTKDEMNFSKANTPPTIVPDTSASTEIVALDTKANTVQMIASDTSAATEIVALDSKANTVQMIASDTSTATEIVALDSKANTVQMIASDASAATEIVAFDTKANTFQTIASDTPVSKDTVALDTASSEKALQISVESNATLTQQEINSHTQSLELIQTTTDEEFSSSKLNELSSKGTTLDLFTESISTTSKNLSITEDKLDTVKYLTTSMSNEQSTANKEFSSTSILTNSEISHETNPDVSVTTKKSFTTAENVRYSESLKGSSAYKKFTKPELTTAESTSIHPSIAAAEGASKHIIMIYNPSITTLKIGISIAFLTVSSIIMIVLIVLIFKSRRRSIPYVELRLEP